MATPNDPIRCGKCQSELEEGFEFCPECGESLSVTQCAQCQKQIKTGSKFCPYCRTETDKSPTASDKPVDREPVPNAHSTVNKDEPVDLSTSSKRGQWRTRTWVAAIFMGLVSIKMLEGVVAMNPIIGASLIFVVVLSGAVFIWRKTLKRQAMGSSGKPEGNTWGYMVSYLLIATVVVSYIFAIQYG